MELVKQFVKEELKNDRSGHDYQHALRVYSNAKKILKNEKADEKIVLTSALIHDVIDKKLFDNIEERIEVVKNFLKDINYSQKEIVEIIYIISSISWNYGNFAELNSINAKIVRDADRLDAIGAVGIIRTIQFGTSRNQLFYEDINIKQEGDKYSFNEVSKTILSHFYEKLLIVKDFLHTQTAKQIAVEKQKIMESFLEHFYNEL